MNEVPKPEVARYIRVRFDVYRKYSKTLERSNNMVERVFLDKAATSHFVSVFEVFPPKFDLVNITSEASLRQ